MASVQWEWSTLVKRYREKSSGRFLSAQANIELRDHFLDMQKTAMASLAQRVVSGDMSVGDWERAMRGTIKTTFSAEYLYGAGGRRAVTAEMRVELANLITQQYSYLNGFARDLQTGLMSEAQVLARAGLYGDAAVLGFESGASAAWTGIESEWLNRSHSADPCGECPALSALGWQPAGSFSLPGLRACKARCKCVLSRRVKATVAAESQRLRVVA